MIALALLTALAACGGGGATGSTPDGAVPPGFAGLVRFPGFDLGRLSEAEPNDTHAQPHSLPPCWENSTVRIGGTVGTDAAVWGAEDVADHFTIQALVDERWNLEMTFDPFDRLDGLTPNAITLQVLDGDGVVRAEAAGPIPPHTLAFDAAAGETYGIRVGITTGNSAYEINLDIGAGGTQTKFEPTALPDGQKPAQATMTGPHPCAATHVLVGLREGCDVDAFCAAQGLRRGRQLGGGGWCVHFDTPAGEEGAAKARALAADLSSHDDVTWSHPDWIVKPLSEPSDTLYPRQWALRAVGAPGAWEVTKGSPSVVVGVIDTGIIDHPDLAGATAPGYDFVTDPNMGADGGGRDPDPTDPGDELASSGFSTWHGTHVAGIIAARHNGIGIAGLAPDVRIMALRAIGRGGGLVSDVADALLFAAGLYATPEGTQLAEPLPIVNLSVGLSASAFVLEDACNRAANVGVFIVAAAGNNAGAVLFPAAYPTAFAVAAVDTLLTSTAYSNFGPEIELAAPGGYDLVDRWNDGWTDAIVSLLRDETVFPGVDAYGSYIGTSQAAPHVAAAAALLLSVDPSLTRQEIRQYLIGGAFDVGVEGRDVGHGFGLLQAQESLNLLLIDQGTPRTDPPKLFLPALSTRLEGFSLNRSLPMFNIGGGRVEIASVDAETISGGVGWIFPDLDPAPTPGGPISHTALLVRIDRNLLSSNPGQYAGHVRLLDASGAVLGRVEVVAHVGQTTRAGCPLRNVAIDVDTGGAPRTSFARPEFGYRYWIKKMPLATYKLRAGEDLNGNGLSCEPGEACGYYGGPSEGDAVPVEYQPLEDPLFGLDIWIVPTSGP